MSGRRRQGHRARGAVDRGTARPGRLLPSDVPPGDRFTLADRGRGGLRTGAHDAVFDTETEAVALANDSEYGLAASIWTRDVDRPLRIGRDLQVGTVWVNDWVTDRTRDRAAGQSTACLVAGSPHTHLELPVGESGRTTGQQGADGSGGHRRPGRDWRGSRNCSNAALYRLMDRTRLLY